MACTFEELQQGGVDNLFGPETQTTDLMHLTAVHHRSETFCTSCLLYRKEGPFRCAPAHEGARRSSSLGS